MLKPTIAKEVLEAALSMGGSFAEIFLEDRLNNALLMRNEKVESISSGRFHGAGVRVFHQMRCVYAYANDTSREGLLDCASKIAAAVRSAPQEMDITLSPSGTISETDIFPSVIVPVLSRHSISTWASVSIAYSS